MKDVGKWSCNPAKDWPRSFIEWFDGDTAFLSVVFSWDLPQAHMRAAWLNQNGYNVKAGGPAVWMNPSYLSEVADVNESGVTALYRHNRNAVFTSRGCIRRCRFCAVPTLEGRLVELTDWEPKPVVCDNNFLACSKKHFDRAIDKLKAIRNVDFNQGLDARLLTPYHASRLAELDLSWIRLAFDHTSMEKQFRRAYKELRSAGFPAAKIAVYVLIGWNDMPDEALYRLEIVGRELGCRPFPMRYQPLDALVRSSYVAEGWTRDKLWKMVTYWTRRELWHIPFEQFAAHRGYHAKYKLNESQLELIPRT